ESSHCLMAACALSGLPTQQTADGSESVGPVRSQPPPGNSRHAHVISNRRAYPSLSSPLPNPLLQRHRRFFGK
ncbi:hypothetical protein, partial [Salmonella enterica]|uniref:hypothetical protein n=1 Tax=Salmonella enterica TaxID=28901 RepID=UPI003298D25C